MSVKHSLDSLSAHEIVLASAASRRARKSGLFFRNIFNLEPPKAQLIPHLDAEHAGTLCLSTKCQVARLGRESNPGFTAVKTGAVELNMESSTLSPVS